ncbi:hypothetical protein F0919_07495 [Taibaiella lutea]|uniref:GLPGLI family protein n=1 Tax=Taibaiella lutea TaxID=2608001 RepID=A0A5M6CJ26_9BACT|nr:hypothetical protein [Taibaiella lutea]KAA5534460.1 hypothetical protein F0919_07495 [Taibaiella lutea]
MKIPFLFLCFALLGFASNAQESVDAAAIEPKAQFQLNVNDTFYLLNEKELLKVTETLVKPTISIQLADFKKFNSNYVSFEYPRQYTFEFNEDAGINYKNWIFSGNDIKVMLFQFGSTVSIDALIDGMVSKFGKRNCKVTPFKKKLGIKVCEGRSLRVSMAEQLLNMDFYELSSNGEGTIIMAFQSSLEDDGSSSGEYKTGFKTIDNSISY